MKYENERKSTKRVMKNCRIKKVSFSTLLMDFNFSLVVGKCSTGLESHAGWCGGLCLKVE